MNPDSPKSFCLAEVEQGRLPAARSVGESDGAAASEKNRACSIPSECSDLRHGRLAEVEEVRTASRRLITQNQQAYEELAK